jgi:hypothetical protein
MIYCSYKYFRWFDAGEDDNSIERDLEQPKAMPWTAIVTTGTDKTASPEVPVLMVLYGEQDKSEEITLGQDPTKDLKSGNTDEFNVISITCNFHSVFLVVKM